MGYPRKMLRFRGGRDIPPDLAFARNSEEESDLREDGFQVWAGDLPGMADRARRLLEGAAAEWDEVQELERLFHG